MDFEAKHLTCRKGERFIFRNLNFTVRSGQICFLKGANGTGKSSLLKILAGLNIPEKGTIVCKDTASAQAPADFCSYLGHKDGLRLLLTARENIHFQLGLTDLPYQHLPLDEYVKALDLQSVAHLPCHLLSQGQRRKVALLCVLLKQRTLWLLDEPFTALDKHSSGWLEQQFKMHLSKGGMIIMACHTPLLSLEADVTIRLGDKERLC